MLETIGRMVRIPPVNSRQNRSEITVTISFIPAKHGVRAKVGELKHPSVFETSEIWDVDYVADAAM